jgi:hypothetical protein
LNFNGPNNYGYVLNNPVRLIDPSGLAGYSLARCRKILETIKNLMLSIEERMDKYDPSSDWKGGFPVGHGSPNLTKPWSHYWDILREQGFLAYHMSDYIANCTGPNGPGLPRWYPDPYFWRQPVKVYSGCPSSPGFRPSTSGGSSSGQQNGQSNHHGIPDWAWEALVILLAAGAIGATCFFAPLLCEWVAAFITAVAEDQLQPAFQ